MVRRVQNGLLYCLAIVALMVGLTSCNNNGPNPPEDEPEGVLDRTILVYQVANNTGLDYFSLADLKEMLQGAENKLITNGRLVVYNHSYNHPPVLVRVTTHGLDTLKTYNTDITSVHAERMLQVFSDVEHYAPALDYGLILWGHGSGWLQDGIADNVPSQRKSYGGEDRAKWMNITTLAQVLEEGPSFSFVYFDCCFMASVEVAYQLRHVTPMIAGTVSELPAEGMPYHLTLGYLFSPDRADLLGAIKTAFDYYDEWKVIGSRPEANPPTFDRRYCNMSVISTDGLDRLAESVKQIYELTPKAYPDNFVPQRFERRPLATASYFDLGQYVEALCVDEDGNELFEGATAALDNFKKALDQTIAYQNTMPIIFGGDFTVDYHCGLSTYILRDASSINNKNYNTLSWYEDVASYLNLN